MATEEQKKRVAAQTGAYVLVIAAIVVIANMLAAKVYTRKDVTRTERFTLSQGSGRLLSTLKQPIQIDAYVKTGLPQLDAFVGDLTDLLKEYERAGKGKFKFTLIEANTDELRSQAKEAGLQEQPFVDPSQTSEDQAAVAQGYMGLVFKYESEKTVIPFLSPASQDGLEFWITNKIREIRDKADDIKHRIGVISDKDELKLSDQNLIPKQGKQQGAPTMQSIMEQNFPFYKTEEVKLSETTAIDKDLVGLIITQPRKDYTEKELRRIDEFMMLGNKSLVVYASAVTMKPQDATMTATLDLHKLDTLLTGYGIQMNKDAVLDFGNQFRLPMRTQSGIGWIRNPGIVHVVNDSRFDSEAKSLDTSFPPFFRLEEIAFPFASSLTLKRDKQPADVKLEVVARTTPQTSIDKSDTVNMSLRPDWSPKPPQESRAIAAYASGKLKSAFAGSPDPGITVPERAAKDSRVLVVSSSLFLSNPFAYAGNGPDLGGQFAMFGNVGGDENLLRIAQPYVEYLTNTIISFKNTLDWLSGDSDLVAASAKLIGDPHLVYSDVAKPKFKSEDDPAEIKRKDEDYRNSRKALQRNVQWTLTLGIPILFGLFGVFRWRRREALRAELKV
jgi:ABC-type uncharacterized transport system involved in gliding motility auxiliary subunit